MCKLCNTDSPSIRPRKNTEYHSIVYDYIGEYACTQCTVALLTAAQKSGSLDRVILYKLYHAYRGFKLDSLINAKNTQLVTSTSILGIRVMIHPTRRTLYKAAVTIGPKAVYLGIFHTLKEALEVKLAYCLEHKHNKAVKLIQDKLKEIQNGNSK